MRQTLGNIFRMLVDLVAQYLPCPSPFAKVPLALSPVGLDPQNINTYNLGLIAASFEFPRSHNHEKWLKKRGMESEFLNLSSSDQSLPGGLRSLSSTDVLVLEISYKLHTQRKEH